MHDTEKKTSRVCDYAKGEGMTNFLVSKKNYMYRRMTGME